MNLRLTSDGLTNGPQIAYLYETYGVTTINGGGSYSESWLSNTASGSGSDYAAGLQLAIWDLLANGGATSGNLTYHGETAATDSFVSFFLYQATSNTGYAQWADSHATQPDGYTMGQSFLVPASVMVNTPEPSALTLVGLALACLTVRARHGMRARAEKLLTRGSSREIARQADEDFVRQLRGDGGPRRAGRPAVARQPNRAGGGDQQFVIVGARGVLVGRTRTHLNDATVRIGLDRMDWLEQIAQLLGKRRGDCLQAGAGRPRGAGRIGIPIRPRRKPTNRAPSIGMPGARRRAGTAASRFLDGKSVRR